VPSPNTTPSSGEQEDHAKASAPSSGSTAAPDRLTLRLRVLEIAASTTATFASSQEPGKVKASELFALADLMLAWVLQEPARHTIEFLEP
jgi:hypothetical protein